MKDDFECGIFDELENELIFANVSFSEIARTYARFLLSLIEQKRFDSIASSPLHMLKTLLSDATLPSMMNDELLRKKLSSELWGMEKRFRKGNVRLAELIRCVLFCYETEERWEAEGPGDATPIYLYYLILRKVLPDVAEIFIHYFQSELLRKY
ncbi:hypothetical protein JRG42_12125 [Pseudomonas granadensis]|uniref:hypothetical protein n=1 Tax=Pseudomonas granadensis TaxID=1421430 RepID=UPI0019D2D5BA|nr:hypothetical protein [Pseudomonas granadensis]MBN6774281.1 hypothetical protein [Pseudomonas granadensis]MBN6805245.1 hypothetical protein [Pseudomonas granadensis]MBN6832307.1 hypothetical protein [Pseudomonas granadensis]MBN6839439.1 hypothetical protein [Pseudomonas granadensis]MBN6868730.1 hypothetical protein [Pseudomonas granadensis]